jgi:hypothetical protein
MLDQTEFITAIAIEVLRKMIELGILNIMTNLKITATLSEAARISLKN